MKQIGTLVVGKGRRNILDNFCDTRDTLAVGVGKQLHDGRVHPYFTCRSSHCAGVRTLSETITLFTSRLREGRAGAKGVRRKIHFLRAC